MALVKQIAVAMLVVALVALAWLRFDPAPGQILLAGGSALPAALRPLVSAIVPDDEAPRIGATRGPGARPAPLVTLDEAAGDRTRQRLRAVGTGEALRSVAVYPEEAGLITAIGFESGQTVEAGTILVQLQDDTQRLELDRARIALEAAQAQAQRYRALSASSAASVTAVQLDEVDRIAQNAQLDLRAAELALSRRQVRAPIAGRVGLSALEVGALVGTQTLIATIDDRSRLKVVFNAPEAFVSELSVGHGVSAVTTNRTGRVFEGEIATLDSRLDEASRTLRAEAVIDNASDELRPGMSFSITLDFPGESYLSVDALAIQWDRSGPYVWTLRGDSVHRAGIEIVERSGERVLVASDDLREGQSVVREGVQTLREGMSVRVEAGADPAPPAPGAGVPAASARPEAPRARGEPSLIAPAAAAEIGG